MRLSQVLILSICLILCNKMRFPVTPPTASSLICICSQRCSVCPFLPHKFHHWSLEDYVSCVEHPDLDLWIQSYLVIDLNTQILPFPIALTAVLHDKCQSNNNPHLLSKVKKKLLSSQHLLDQVCAVRKIRIQSCSTKENKFTSVYFGLSIPLPLHFHEKRNIHAPRVQSLTRQFQCRKSTQMHREVRKFNYSLKTNPPLSHCKTLMELVQGFKAFSGNFRQSSSISWIRQSNLRVCLCQELCCFYYPAVVKMSFCLPSHIPQYGCSCACNNNCICIVYSPL